MRIKKVLFTTISAISVLLITAASIADGGKKHIRSSQQRTGDVEKGYQYLINGDYVSSGIPYALYKTFPLNDSSNVLQRSGDAALIPPQFNLIENDKGVKIVAPNCLTCHSDYINGEFIVGLGNTSFDYSIEIQAATDFLNLMIQNQFGQDSETYKAFQSFYKASKALQGELKTAVRGVNPADKLTAVLVAHRHPDNLEWSDEVLLNIPEQNIPTDVPPWWLLKKKNAMFYTGIGRGDFSKFLMASSILTLTDSTEARKIDEKFPDILAWIEGLEAPKFPGDIDEELTEKGQRIFELNCEGCHGSYGNDADYPNYMISLEKVGTDPYLSKAYTDSLYKEFIDWYDDSWFAKSDNPGELVIEEGYVAPPLDGIWATAPYLHNGSVPTVEALLNSKIRPDVWERSFRSDDYNFKSLGWNYTVPENPSSSNAYDTSIPAYGNEGHYFGDDLEDAERKALLEYLKTL